MTFPFPKMGVSSTTTPRETIPGMFTVKITISLFAPNYDDLMKNAHSLTRYVDDNSRRQD